MKVWIDLANSPHVPVFRPVIERLRERGNKVVLTARDHAQTVELARMAWDEVTVVGGASAPGLAAKGRGIAARAVALARLARRWRPDVALSHGSYAQLLAGRLAGVPSVTMVDYEHQPVNHLSFRLAQRVVVPEAFPADAVRHFGAARKILRYQGFKEELYLTGPTPPLDLDLDEERILVVLRPPPVGAVYHRHGNDRFEEVLALARARPDIQVVVLPRSPAQADRYQALDGVLVPERAVNGHALLARADVVVGAGGTMSREAALLGTPTYTVFSGKLGAVDAELIRQGRLLDLRDPATTPRLERKQVANASVAEERRAAILDVIEGAVRSVARHRRGRGGAPARARP